MVNTTNGPEAAYPGPDDKTPQTDENHDSGLEQDSSESTQGAAERPVDWDPPPQTPVADQGAEAEQEKSGVKTDSLIDSE